jgi:hypothetical protein
MEQSYILIFVCDSQKILLISSQIIKKMPNPSQTFTNHKFCQTSSLVRQTITNRHKHKHCKSCVIVNVRYCTIHKLCKNLLKTWYELKYESLWIYGVCGEAKIWIFMEWSSSIFCDLRYGDQMPMSQITNILCVFVSHKQKLRYETAPIFDNSWTLFQVVLLNYFLVWYNLLIVKIKDNYCVDGILTLADHYILR